MYMYSVAVKFVFECWMGSSLPLVAVREEKRPLQLQFSPTIKYQWVFSALQPQVEVMSPLQIGTPEWGCTWKLTWTRQHKGEIYVFTQVFSNTTSRMRTVGLANTRLNLPTSVSCDGPKQGSDWCHNLPVTFPPHFFSWFIKLWDERKFFTQVETLRTRMDAFSPQFVPLASNLISFHWLYMQLPLNFAPHCVRGLFTLASPSINTSVHPLY